jgi:putative spermidine/putrescine transport system permease protein
MLERRVAPTVLALTLAIAAVCVLPPIVAISASFAEPGSEAWTAGSYTYVLQTYGETLLVSLRLALLVVSGSLLLGAPAAYAIVRHRFSGIAAVEWLATTPLSLPGVTIALAVIVAHAQFRGSLLLLAGAQMLYTTPYVVRIVSGAMRLVPLREYEMAARTLGADASTRFVRVTLPLLLQPVGMAALVVFAISWGEFNVAFLLATPQQTPFPAALYATFTGSSSAVSGAATAIFIAGALPFLFALQWFERSSGEYAQTT